MADGKDDLQKRHDRLGARQRMMDHLARRAHSETELRQKLEGKFDPDDIEAALQYGQERGWVPKADESKAQLSESLAESLHLRLKGIDFINEHLAQKGLPPIAPDPSRELEKARKLLENRFPDTEGMDHQSRSRASRLLASRGFDLELIQSLLFKR